MRLGIDRRAMGALFSGHLAVDFASGSVPALIPFMTDKFHLGYALSAMLLLAATASSSLVQPLFGLLSDRRGALWLIPGGALLAAVGVGGAAISPVYPLVLVLVFAGGLGVAAFHPEGAKFAAYASGHKRASGMAYFNSGGNAGYALGAFVTGQLVVWLGLVGGLVAMVPVLLVGLGLARVMAHLSTLQPVDRDIAYVRGDDRRRAMALLGIVISLRSVSWFTLLAFVPLWLVSLGHSKAEGNRLLFLMLLAGAAGTLVLGPVADRIGLRTTLVITQALVTPLVLVFIYVGGIPGAIALMFVGVCVVGTFGVTMVLSQLYLPRHVGMASGLSVGLAMGVGGVAAVILGAVADAVDLKTALTICALAPALGVFICMRLPAPSARGESSRRAAAAVAPLAD
ncbi:MAG TPA: MFS transporter [Gaiellaceae bacterium]|jgi:FSR family fosmidomycin resistance protein-like MFS transporter|nr:MFS transporter [Gaiellaceae bacterium]